MGLYHLQEVEGGCNPAAFGGGDEYQVVRMHTLYQLFGVGLNDQRKFFPCACRE